MIWTHIRSGCSTSDTKTKLQHQMAALSGLSFYVDEMKKTCPESMPLRSGSRVRRVTHNSNNIQLDEVKFNNNNNNNTAQRTQIGNTHGNICRAHHVRWKNHAGTLHKTGQRL
jgi:hypothetical protein